MTEFAIIPDKQLEQKEPLLSITVTSDGHHIIAGTTQGKVLVWEFATSQLLHQMKAHNAAVEAVTSSPDGRLVVSCSLDKTIKVSDLTTGKVVHTLKDHTAFLIGFFW